MKYVAIPVNPHPDIMQISGADIFDNIVDYDKIMISRRAPAEAVLGDFKVQRYVRPLVIGIRHHQSAHTGVVIDSIDFLVGHYLFPPHSATRGFFGKQFHYVAPPTVGTDRDQRVENRIAVLIDGVDLGADPDCPEIQIIQIRARRKHGARDRFAIPGRVRANNSIGSQYAIIGDAEIDIWFEVDQKLRVWQACYGWILFVIVKTVCCRTKEE